MTPEPLTAPAKPEAACSRPFVLVGIVTRNRSDILPKAIQSALSQNYPHVRIAVLDDGSEDGTPALQSDFPAVQWHRWEHQQGILEARNQLMRTAIADSYYLSLDDDAWFIGRDEIALAIEHLEANSRVAAVAFDILSPDRPRPAARSAAAQAPMYIGCGHLLRLSAVREAGFYTPSPGFYGSEEKDLCLRLLDRDWDIHLLPGVHVWHDKTTVSRDEVHQHRSGVCNDLVFAARRCPLPLLLAVFPIKLWNHLRFSAGHRLLRPCLAGFGLFVRHAWAVWSSRDPVRARTFGEYTRRSRGRP
jgi:GT2 family glycosyltransferase